MRKTPFLTLTLPAVLTLLVSCGGGSTPTPNPDPGGNSALKTKLAACPVVHNSSDPADSACLTGTYTGKKSDNTPCSLTLRANGSYDFSSSNLTYSYTPTSESFRLMIHSSAQGNHTLVWGIIDTYSVPDAKELNFQASFGPYVDSSMTKIEIKATHHIGLTPATNSATCTVSL